MTEPTMTTAEALAAVQKQLAALEKVLDERRFAEAAVITLANGNFLTATDSHRFPVGNAAMGTLYGASEMFEKLGDNWDDLLSDIRSSVHELASLAISEKTQPMNISQHLETFPGFSSAIAPASRPDAWASQEFEPIYDMLSRLWSNAGRLGKWASAHDLDNTLLARLKSYSAIMEVIPHPESFRYKAVGDDIAKHSPFDLAGKDSWEMVTQGWSLAAYRAHHSEMFALFANAYRQKRLVSLSGSVDAYGTLLIDAAAAPFTTNGLWPDVIFAVMMIRPITRN